jgi:hypothetical protein
MSSLIYEENKNDNSGAVYVLDGKLNSARKGDGPPNLDS